MSICTGNDLKHTVPGGMMPPGIFLCRAEKRGTLFRGKMFRGDCHGQKDVIRFA